MTLRRLLHLFVVLTTLGVAWIAIGERQAFAGARGAPWCDPRGATGFAPPPQLEETLQSIDVGMNDADCTESPLTVRFVIPRTAPPLAFSLSQEPARGVHAVVPPAVPVLARLPAPVACPLGTRPGVRSTVDRPPRA